MQARPPARKPRLPRYTAVGALTLGLVIALIWADHGIASTTVAQATYLPHVARPHNPTP